MTIAAGFLYQGGLLLCADTQATGAYKIQGSKVLPNDYDDGTVTVFATGGQVSYARMGVQLIEAAIGGIGPTCRTLAAIEGTLINELYSLFVKHLYLHPSWQINTDLHVQYLIGVWSGADKQLALFKTEDTAVERLYGYDCIGSGADLAHYLIRPIYPRRPTKDAPITATLDEVKELAFNSLDRVKGHNPYCGGNTTWMTLSNTGKRDAGAMQSRVLGPPISQPARQSPTRGRKGRTPSRG